MHNDYDEPAKPQKPGMKPATRALIKRGILWFLYIWVYRVVTLILYSMFFGNTIQVAIHENSFATARGVTILTSLLSVVLFGIFYSVFYSRSNGDERRSVIVAAREPAFGTFKYFRRYLPEMGMYSGIHLVTQLIFCGFFTAFGFRYDQAQTIIEKLHIADSGFYLSTGIPILGLLLNTLYMGAVICLCRVVVLLIWQKDKANRVDKD